MDIDFEDRIDETTLADGDTITGEASITGKDAYVYTTLDEGASWTVNNADGDDVTDNYSITVTGQLTIMKAGETQYQGTVALDDWTYGDEAKVETASTNGGDYGDPTYYYKKADEGDEAYTETKPTDAGNYVVKAVWAETDNCNEISATDTFTINKREITLTTQSASKVYDGTALTAPGSIEGLVNNETATLNVTGSQTNVGSSDNIASIVWDGTADKNNYEVTNDFGTLTVTKQSINPEDPDDPSSYKNVTVNNPSDVTYDGNSHQWKPTVTSGNMTLTEGTDYTVSYSTNDFTNVTGTITVTIKGTGNYRGTVTRTYQINPRAITLTSAGGTKTYDGTALTNGTVTLTGELVDPSDITYRATGTQTEVGSSLNTIEVNYASDQMRANYTVRLVTGTLTVNAAPTTPTTPGGGEGTGTTPATGGPVAAADDDADAEDEPEEEEVEDEETPLSDGEEEVDEGKTPLAKIDAWALINLIAAIITVLFGLILLLSKRHKNDDEEDEEERQARIERGEEKEQEQKRGWICKVLGVLVAIGSVVLFILTEDMSLPMAMTDEWTIWMVIIAVVELVLLLVGRHWKDVDDEDQEQQA